MSDRNFLFVRIVLGYTSSLLTMSRETLRSSDLYGVLMEAVAKVGIVVGPCDGMMSSMV